MTRLWMGLLLLAACASKRPDNRATVEALLAGNDVRASGKLDLKVESVATEMPAQEEEYRLGTGDVLQLNVVGHPEFSSYSDVTPTGLPVGFRIQADGNLYLPHFSVPARGRTLVEVQKTVVERLAEYIQEPHATLEIVRYDSQKFYVLGAVHAPGVFAVDGQKTLLEGLALAGGARPEGDLERAYVIRGRTLLPISLGDMLLRGDTSRNVVMRHGDLVFIPQADDWKVYVVGEVTHAGPVRIPQQTGLSLAAAIGEVGGFDLTHANLSDVTIYRGGWQKPLRFTLHVQDVYEYGTSILLQPGDRVVVGPRGLATFSRTVSLILPLLQAAVTDTAAAIAIAQN